MNDVIYADFSPQFVSEVIEFINRYGLDKTGEALLDMGYSETFAIAILKKAMRIKRGQIK